MSRGPPTWPPSWFAGVIFRTKVFGIGAYNKKDEFLYKPLTNIFRYHKILCMNEIETKLKQN